LPRPDPFTQADIEARSQLTGLPKIADPKPVRSTAKELFADIKPEDVLSPTEVRIIEAEVQKEIDKEIRELCGITDKMRHLARNWNFSPAIDTLGVRHIQDRRRCEDELILICVVNRQVVLAEEQETPGRKARAFQLAPRVAKKLDLLAKEGRKAPYDGKALARCRQQRGLWLPQSLEQEGVRVLGHIPRSRDDFALLREQMTRMARPGCYKSWALRITIRALQVCAAAWNKKLVWNENRRSPPKRLRKFLVKVLDAAEIDHPNPETNYSKFIALMLRPKKDTGEQPSEKPPDASEAWRPLAEARAAASAYAATPEGKARLERVEELFWQWFESS
jgi:hypothetical protein